MATTKTKTKKTTITVEFWENGEVKSVSQAGKELKPATLYRDPITLANFTAVGVAFLETERASPAWCSAVIGGVLYRWEC